MRVEGLIHWERARGSESFDLCVLVCKDRMTRTGPQGAASAAIKTEEFLDNFRRKRNWKRTPTLPKSPWFCNSSFRTRSSPLSPPTASHPFTLCQARERIRISFGIAICSTQHKKDHGKRSLSCGKHPYLLAQVHQHPPSRTGCTIALYLVPIRCHGNVWRNRGNYWTRFGGRGWL